LGCAQLVAPSASICEVLNSDAYLVLRARFGSAVSLGELRSIAMVIAMLGDVRPPGREVKRSKVLMIKWFADNWQKVAPWLPFIALLDETLAVVDGRRELADRETRR
jgi:hypothetical protein